MMLRSMTAYAREEGGGDWGSAVWELRSVNNRYLDVFTRIPEDLRGLEPAVRERVAARVNRGKVECQLRFQPAPAGGESLGLNMDLAERLSKASREIDKLIYNPAPISSVEILRWPGVIETPPLDLDQVGGAVLTLLDSALDDLVATREREGARIRALIAERCTRVNALAVEVRGALPEILDGLRERLGARLAELKAEVDPTRLEQEMVILAQRMDVAEELDRLEAHVQEVERALKGGKPVGRRLDFLMQELNREANTLGSKSVSAETTRASVDLKVLIEQMREQIQNLE